VTRYVVSPDAATAAVDDGAVVLHLGTKRYYSLNSTGAMIWGLLEAGVAEDAIIGALLAAYETELPQARESFRQLVAELAAESLVSVDDA
jgi:hypothetical protein